MLTMLTMHHAYWSLAINALIMMGSNRGNSYTRCMAATTVYYNTLFSVLVFINNTEYYC